ncbi:hypothetical protein [Rubinisphaera sp.]|uniref:hypothetical protein n=1 Tax=Rubinisphaera sp. TaxID=2024857 RepID=UPI000C121E02|nr:hypothetical protein [Rubinisphaera sp.]MBV09645.1 hypothetical protein [Rubinisphaera sp.]HCS54979.1 hypothetical protein [Planctomycetaceae bacterium]|tara:strand:+ start:267 stop:707 length:441 start_codon:yes stop_codon:yes gene_type:complete
MGYELHIVRNEEWWDEETGGGISFAEWSTLVDADVSLRMDSFAEVNLKDDMKLRIESEGLTVWTEYAGNEEGGNQAWFDFHENAIVVKNPDQDILVKMLEIAKALDAKIIGEEGEEYQSPTDHGVPTRLSKQEILSNQSKPWWRFW